MIKKVTFTLFFLTVTLFLAGWCNCNSELEKGNPHLETKLVALNQLDEVKNTQGKDQADYNELSKLLDNNLRNALSDLIGGDYSAAQQYFAPTAYIVDKTIITQINDLKGEFLIPDRQMNLKRRLSIMNSSIFTSIYEIYDAGYNSGNKYADRTYTLDIEYVKVNREWKISYLAIDE